MFNKQMQIHKENRVELIVWQLNNKMKGPFP